MTERVTQNEQVERDVAADRLNDVASALRDAGPAHIQVGNKRVALHPSETVDYSIEIVEKKRRFRGNSERVVIELNWKPTQPREPDT